MARFRRLTLRHKILVGTVGLVVFLTVAFYLTVHFVLMPRLEAELIRRSHAIGRAVSAQAGGYVITHDQPHLLRLLFEKRALEESVSYLIVTDASGKLLADTFIEEMPPGLLAAHSLPQGKHHDVQLVSVGGQSYYDMAHPVMEGIYRVGTVRVGMSKALVDDVMGGIYLALAGVMGLLVVVAIWAANRFTRQITRPVAALTRAADEIAAGNLDVRLGDSLETTRSSWLARLAPSRGLGPKGEVRDEIELLTGTFARMVEQLKHSRDELRQAYDFRDNLLRSSPDAVVATDEAGRIVLFNEGAERLFGRTAAEVLGREGAAFLHPARVGAEIEAALERAGRLVDFETLILDRSGRQVQVSVSASRISDHGRTVGTVRFLRDLTERKRMEEEVQRADKLATVGRAAAYISHEIKNPLMVIGGLARQVASERARRAKEREKLAIIIKEIKRLEAILLEIGEYTRASRLEKRPIALPGLLEEVLQLMQGVFERRRVEVATDLPEGLPAAAGDPMKLKQVFINLIKNAADAMPHGGLLVVSSRLRDGHLEVRIADSGEGIPPEVMRQLFKPFFTTKPRGSGLGLTISRQIIKDHQGELRIESEPGRGTQCVISLPAA